MIEKIGNFLKLDTDKNEIYIDAYGELINRETMQKLNEDYNLSVLKFGKKITNNLFYRTLIDWANIFDPSAFENNFGDIFKKLDQNLI